MRREPTIEGFYAEGRLLVLIGLLAAAQARRRRASLSSSSQTLSHTGTIFHVPSLSTRINMSREALTRAIKMAGGYRALARAAGVSHQSVMKWKRVLAVEELTGIPRHVLRPDIYPPSKEQRGRR